MVKQTPKNTVQNSQVEEVSPFYVIRYYRKTLKLKKQRDIRKQKSLEQKHFLKEVQKNQKMTMIQQLNRSMLEDDIKWDKFQQQVKIQSSEDFYTTDHESDINKKIQKLRWEVLFTLGSVQKQSVFVQNFSSFDFGMQ